jgi:hypothetical protein
MVMVSRVPVHELDAQNATDRKHPKHESPFCVVERIKKAPMTGMAKGALGGGYLRNQLVKTKVKTSRSYKKSGYCSMAAGCKGNRVESMEGFRIRWKARDRWFFEV